MARVIHIPKSSRGARNGVFCECMFVYMFCPPLWKRRTHLPCIVNGARASAAILLIVLSSNIPVPTLGGLAYAVVLKSCIFRTMSIILMDILRGTSQLTATWHQSTITITALFYPSIIWWNFVGHLLTMELVLTWQLINLGHNNLFGYCASYMYKSEFCLLHILSRSCHSKYSHYIYKNIYELSSPGWFFLIILKQKLYYWHKVINRNERQCCDLGGFSVGCTSHQDEIPWQHFQVIFLDDWTCDLAILKKILFIFFTAKSHILHICSLSTLVHWLNHCG